jgi:mutual gliding-motility protein MglA
MALFNYATKEITLKIVYYGPGLSGKTTNLQYLHSILNPETKGKLLSLSTEADRTLFFDFLPVELGKIRDFSIRFQLYTVPGQVRYNATRKVVLKGADAVVFVADSQKAMREQNIESLANMRENLSSNNIDPDDIPTVLQYNKRDLKNISTIEELNADLNTFSCPVIESSALDGAGVEDTFKLVTKLLIRDIARKHNVGLQQETKEAPAEPPAAPSLSETAAEVSPSSSTVTAQKEALPGESKAKALAAEAGKAAAVEAVPAGKIDLLVDEIVKIHGILIELRNSMGKVTDEMNTLKGMREKQRGVLSSLYEIEGLVKKKKKKKKWFIF